MQLRSVNIFLVISIDLYKLSQR